MRKELVSLEDRVDLPFMRRQIADVLSFKDNLSVVGFQKTGDNTQHRRFTAAGRAEEGNELFVFDVEADVVKHHLVTEFLGDVSQFDDRVVSHG